MSSSSEESDDISFVDYVESLRIPFEEIKLATNNFTDANLLPIQSPSSSSFQKLIYKGQLKQSGGELIDIVARKIPEEQDNIVFNELLTSYLITHKNILPVFKISGTDNPIIINKYEANESLDKHLSDSSNLTWMQRLHICVGVAHALSYIHDYDAEGDFSVIHGNIKSSKILLDENWEPKLNCFGFSMFVKKYQPHLASRYSGTLQYTDPVYVNTGCLTHESDVYSFGVVLFEVLFGRIASVKDEEDNWYFARLARSNYEEKTLDDMIVPDLLKQMNLQSLEIFSETAYYCLEEESSRRPNMAQIVEKLEASLELQQNGGSDIMNFESNTDDAPMKVNIIVDHDPTALETEGSVTSVFTGVESHVSKKTMPSLKDLSQSKLSYQDVSSATNGFAHENVIKEFGFGEIYKGRLLHSKQFIDIIAKRFFSVTDKRKEFCTEISMLSSLKHKNLVSLIGFHDSKHNKFIIYKKEANGSLDNYLNDMTLTWMQRLKICLGVANALSYIHYDAGRDFSVIHCNIRSSKILLDDKWEPKLSGFELSLKNTVARRHRLLLTRDIIDNVYMDPKYRKTGGVTHKSDVYSFGVVLLEVLCGRSAVDEDELGEGLLSKLAKSFLDDLINPRLQKQMDPEAFKIFLETAFYCLQKERAKRPHIDEVVNRLEKALRLQWEHENPVDSTSSDHLKIKEETDEHVFSLSKGPDKESLDIFSKIAFRCLVETQAQRPTIEVVIDELKKALDYQENHKDNLKLSLEDIKLATKGFSQDNMIGLGDSGKVYKGAIHTTNGDIIIAAKRFNKKLGQGDAKFMAELDILVECKHENVIGLVGYCVEDDEKIIVHEYASRGSLDKYLSDDSLTWVLRLKICIDIAIGLEFLHGTEMVIHRDIKSRKILLFDDWKAKISDFGLSLVCPTNQDVDYVIDNVTGTIGYRDPLYSKTGFLTKESDIFSLGAVLFDILCGKLSSEKLDDEYLYLPFLAKHHYHEGKLDMLVFEGIKEQIVPQSYVTFTRIALQCLHHRRESRPTAHEVVIQLKKSLEFQEDYEKWEPKLPKDYNEIIQMSKCPEDYTTIKKQDLYNIFSKGILLQQDKVLLSFDGDGERNEMVSATTFSYNNSCRHEWKSLPESRFGRVVEMLDISNLNIEIKIDAQFLSPDVVYGAFLVFRLCDSRIVSSKPMCVNLKYRKGHESLHAYFATWRDKDWMMIELYQFLNQNEDVVFEFLLERFSSHYCGESAVYVEGIEFRAIDKVKSEEFKELKEVQQVLKSNFNVDQVQQLPTEEIFKIHSNYDQLFWMGELNRKKLLVLSAKAALYKFYDVDLFTSKPSAQSRCRFQEVIELLPQQVFYLKCTIKSQMLSPDTEYVCYLVFKLSEECQGLHNPVKVRDLIHQENNEAEFFYFITPSLLNIHDFTRVPKQRDDGWMEIQVWKFDSAHEFKDDSLSIDMKFTSYEGIMSGLIICGLEFRPL